MLLKKKVGFFLVMKTLTKILRIFVGNAFSVTEKMHLCKKSPEITEWNKKRILFGLIILELTFR